MREIKFSYIFQHNETKEFREAVYSYLDIFNGKAKEQIEEYFHDCILIAKRQFIGLQDRNGKNLYEGGIVRGRCFGHEFNLEIKYVIHGYYPFQEIPIEGAITFSSPNECELIGDKYRNPELLK